jgi:hypothetical protein
MSPSKELLLEELNVLYALECAAPTADTTHYADFTEPFSLLELASQFNLPEELQNILGLCYMGDTKIGRGITGDWKSRREWLQNVIAQWEKAINA